jgi:hypothetical protein
VKPHQPEIKWGGRTMAVSVHPNSSSGNRALAATESGGLFRTRDGGNSWSPIEGRYPHRLSDVAHAPSDPSVIIATARGDSRRLERQSPSVSGGGIWRSTDGGQTWENHLLLNPTGNVQVLLRRANPLRMELLLSPVPKTSTWGQTADWLSAQIKEQPGAT